MLRYITLFSLPLVLSLTSCSYFYTDKNLIYNREKEYLQASQIPPLIIPPGVASKSIQAHYPVSEKKYPSVAKPVDLTPPEIIAPEKKKMPAPIQKTQTTVLNAQNNTSNEEPKQSKMPHYYVDRYAKR